MALPSRGYGSDDQGRSIRKENRVRCASFPNNLPVSISKSVIFPFLVYHLTKHSTPYLKPIYAPYGTHLCTWMERGTLRVKNLAQELNAAISTGVRARNARSGEHRTNHQATAPLYWCDFFPRFNKRYWGNKHLANAKGKKKRMVIL